MAASPLKLGARDNIGALGDVGERLRWRARPLAMHVAARIGVGKHGRECASQRLRYMGQAVNMLPALGFPYIHPVQRIACAPETLGEDVLSSTEA